jgi:hypothetical protein
VDPLADAAYAIVAASLFAFVATRVGRRRVDVDLRRALHMFSLWWYGVAVFLVAGALLSILDLSGLNVRALHLAIAALSMLSVCAAVWGLVYYVSYLYTGRSTVFYPMLAYYSGIFAIFLFALFSDGSGRELAAWHASVVRLAILTGPLLTGAIVALLLPAIVALLAYARLYPRVAGRERRYRIGLATSSLVAWFSLAIFARLGGVADTPSWTVIGRLLAIAAALGVLLAYAPPGWLKRLLHMRSETSSREPWDGTPTLRVDHLNRRFSPLP